MAVPFLTVYSFVFANDLTSKYLLSSSLLNTALFSAKKTGLFSSMMTSSIPVSPPATFPLYESAPSSINTVFSGIIRVFKYFVTLKAFSAIPTASSFNMYSVLVSETFTPMRTFPIC